MMRFKTNEMKKKLIFTLVVLFFYHTMIHAQIGATSNNPHKSAALDLNSTNMTANNKGLLIMRVSLANNTDVSSVGGTTPAQSLLIYNINNVNVNGLSGAGFYYWDIAVWRKLFSSADFPTSKYWSTTGNSGTNSGANFLGTTDATDLQIKTNNQPSLTINASTGNLGINTTFPDNSAIIDLNSTNKALRLPRVSLTQSHDISTVNNPKAGMLLYNASSNSINVYDGTQWIQPIATAPPDVTTSRLIAMAITSTATTNAAGMICFDNRTLDIDGAFSGDAINGSLFTVKKSGLYQFFVNLTSVGVPANSAWYVRIKKNGVDIAGIDAAGSTTSQSSADIFAIDSFSVNDVITVQMYNADTYAPIVTRISVFRFE